LAPAVRLRALSHSRRSDRRTRSDCEYQIHQGEQGLSRLKQALETCADDVIDALAAYVPQSADVDAKLYEAMRYSLMAGGKRLRPFLVLTSADLFDVPRERAMPVAAAIEMVHTYSLIHDDLPAMDDDDLRRGKPTCHKQFDEASAILAGDALLTQAFEIVARTDAHPDPAVRAEICYELAVAAGAPGMVGGQVMDLAAEAAAAPFDLDTIIRLQNRKTGALIRFSCEAGAVLAGMAGDVRACLKTYAESIGLAFQIADDLLDHEGDEAAMGKAVGKDAAAGKATFVGLLGVDGARAKAEALVAKAVAELAPFGDRGELLRDVAQYIIDRKN